MRTELRKMWEKKWNFLTVYCTENQLSQTHNIPLKWRTITHRHTDSQFTYTQTRGWTSNESDKIVFLFAFFSSFFIQIFVLIDNLHKLIDSFQTISKRYSGTDRLLIEMGCFLAEIESWLMTNLLRPHFRVQD